MVYPGDMLFPTIVLVVLVPGEELLAPVALIFDRTILQSVIVVLYKSSKEASSLSMANAGITIHITMMHNTIQYNGFLIFTSIRKVKSTQFPNNGIVLTTKTSSNENPRYIRKLFLYAAVTSPHKH